MMLYKELCWYLFNNQFGVRFFTVGLLGNDVNAWFETGIDLVFPFADNRRKDDFSADILYYNIPCVFSFQKEVIPAWVRIDFRYRFRTV